MKRFSYFRRKTKLEHKVVLVILVILLPIGGIGAVAMLHFQRQAAAAQFEKSAMGIVAVIRDSLEHDMRENSREHIQDAVVRITSGTLINEVMILSNTLRVYASGKKSEVGQTRIDDKIAYAISSGQTVTRVEERYGRNELCIILPVENKSECHACHGSSAAILGAIEVGLERSPLDDQIKEQTLLMVLVGGLTFLAVGVGLAVVLKSEVVNPLSRLAASALRIAQGDFSARAKVGEEREVAMVAHAFNEMAEQVEQRARSLEESKKELERMVQERTEQVQQLAAVRGQLLERLISAQEEERKRIARELHDEVGQALTMIMMDLARARDTLPSNAVDALKRLSQSRSLAEQTLTDLRKLIYELRPEVLDQLGLLPALRSYAKSRLETENIKVQFHLPKLKERLSSQAEITLFRVIQEAITNIVRHSGATAVNMDVSLEHSDVVATVEDNGKGFDVETAFNAPGSWGLRGIRERVVIVGGQLNIESKDGHGTRLEVRVPLNGV